MIQVHVQGKTTNEVISNLQAMLKELNGNVKAGAPENKMAKAPKASKAIEEDEEDYEDQDDMPVAKNTKKKAAAVEEDEDFEDEETDEDEEESDEDGATASDARASILALGKKKGSAVAKQVLSRFNLKSVTELEKKSSAKYYQPIVDKCKALMKK